MSRSSFMPSLVDHRQVVVCLVTVLPSSEYIASGLYRGSKLERENLDLEGVRLSGACDADSSISCRALEREGLVTPYGALCAPVDPERPATQKGHFRGPLLQSRPRVSHNTCLGFIRAPRHASLQATGARVRHRHRPRSARGSVYAVSCVAH